MPFRDDVNIRLAGRMRQSIEERKGNRHRALVVERILELRRTAPAASDAALNEARDALRK